MSSYAYKPLLEKPVEGEFELTTEPIIPKEAEVRVVANRNDECRYYYLGIDQCRNKMLRVSGDAGHKFHEYGFLPCKRIVDAHYRCLTEDRYGHALEEIPDEGKEGAQDFINCAFKRLAPMEFCRRYFDEALRGLIRAPNSKLSDV